MSRTQPALVPAQRFTTLVAALALAGCGGDPAEPTLDDAPSADATHDDAPDDAGSLADAVVPSDAGPTADPDATVDLDVPAPPAMDAAPDAPLPLDVPVPRDASPPDVAPPRDVAPPPDAAPPAPAQVGLLRNGAAPMPCADPAVFSENGAGRTYYVYCTGMAHVWRTSDWAHYADVRASTRFDLDGLSANGREVGAWWAPGIVYSPEGRNYVMWVSVPAARGTRTADGWDTRALAVLTANAPTGPWTFRAAGIGATAVGQRYIDPFLFRDRDGARYVYWKQYGGGLSSSIMGARLDASWQNVVGARVEIMNGYGGPGTWEDNVRENPAVWYDPATRRHHMIFSGGHWADDSYATGHALSNCGPLCVNAAGGGWRMVSSGDRGIVQVVRANGLAAFAHGGPGGAVFQDDDARAIVYAAAARGRGDATRYLMRDRVAWRNGAPFVDTAGHHPEGF